MPPTLIHVPLPRTVPPALGKEESRRRKCQPTMLAAVAVERSTDQNEFDTMSIALASFESRLYSLPHAAVHIRTRLTVVRRRLRLGKIDELARTDRALPVCPSHAAGKRSTVSMCS